MATKKRFSLFGGGGGGHVPNSPSPHSTHGHDNDTASVTSDMTGGASWSDHIGSNGKPSFMKRLARPFAHDNTAELIDTGIKNLYLDPDILDKKCMLSIKGLDTVTNLEDLEHAVAAAEKQARVIPYLSYTDKTPEGVIAALPQPFFTPDFDPTGPVTEEIASWGSGDLTQKFMGRIEDADTDKDMVLSRLADMIEENQEELLDLMQDVFSVDLEVSRAANHVSLSRRKIAQSCKIIKEGPMKIVSLQARRDRLVLASEMVRSLKALVDMRKSISSNITTGDLGKAAESACSLIESLQTESYSQFKCLRTIGDGIRRQAATIRRKTDRALVRLCARKFAPEEYGNIVRAYLVLDYMAEAHAVPLLASGAGSGGSGDSNRRDAPEDDEQDEESKRVNAIFDRMGCMEGLAPRALKFHLDDIASCLHTAVLEFLYASQHRKHKVAEAMDMTSAFTPASFGEIMDLAEIPLPQLYKRVMPDTAAQCIVRSCELLTDIVHNHYLITQWHYTPFDERNSNAAFLHRRAIDLSDVDVSGMAFDITAAADNASSSINISSTYGHTQTNAQTHTTHAGGDAEENRSSRSRTASDARNGVLSYIGGEDEVEVPFTAAAAEALPVVPPPLPAAATGTATSSSSISSSIFSLRRSSANTDTAAASIAAAGSVQQPHPPAPSTSSSFFSSFPSFTSSSASSSAAAAAAAAASATVSATASNTNNNTIAAAANNATASTLTSTSVAATSQLPPPLPPTDHSSTSSSSLVLSSTATSSLSSSSAANQPPPPSSSSSSPPTYLPSSPPTSMFRRAARWVGPSSRVNDKVRNKIMSAYESNSKNSAPTFGRPLSPSFSMSPKGSPSRKVLPVGASGAAILPVLLTSDPPTPSSSVYGDSQTKQRGAQLAAVYQQLVADRSALWDQLSRALIELLSSVQFSAMIAMDDFLAITWAVNVMAKLGREFCGSESRAVLACLREKSREYYYNLHSESFHILRQMVDSESWRSIPIRMHEVGGIVGIIERNLSSNKESFSKARMGFVGSRGRDKDKYLYGNSSIGVGGTGVGDYIVDLTSPETTPDRGSKDSSRKAPAAGSSSSSSSAVAGTKNQSSSILVMFAEHGNPLHFLTEAEMRDEQHQIHNNNNGGVDDAEGQPQFSRKDGSGGGGGSGGGSSQQRKRRSSTTGSNHSCSSEAPIHFDDGDGTSNTGTNHHVSGTNSATGNNKKGAAVLAKNANIINKNSRSNNTNNNNGEQELLGVTIENRSVFLGPASSSQYLDELKVLLREEEAFLGEGKAGTMPKKLSNSSSAATVVTQTCLNGLARYAGIYLQLMHMMPAAAVDAFTGLCQLFDFYLAAVFWGFVPHDERLKIHRKQPKPVAAAPNQSKDFEALQSYMERVLNEFVRVSTAPVVTTAAAAHNSSFQSITQSFGMSMPHMNIMGGMMMGGGGGGGGGTNGQHGQSTGTEDSSGKFGGGSCSGLADGGGGGSTGNSKHSLDGSFGAYTHELDEQGARGGSVLTATSATGPGGVIAAAGGGARGSSSGPSPTPLQPQGPPQQYQYLAPITPMTNPLPGESARLFTVLRVPSCVSESADTPSSSSTISHHQAPTASRSSNMMGAILSPLKPSSSPSSTKAPLTHTLSALHERIVAAESCWFASKVLSELKFKLIRLLPEQYLSPCESYVSHFQLVSGQLRGLVYRAVSPKLIESNAVLTQISDSHACGWESSNLRQNCHDWVTDLIIRCSEVWEYLVTSSGEFDEASEPVREQVWMEVCQAAFDAVLEGFSRVKKLSTEGRAAMAMDVTDLQAGLDEIRPCRPPRGKHYVDYYVRATYLQEEELIKWVHENWQMYAYRHIQGLLAMSLSSLPNSNNSKRLKEVTSMVDALYDSDGFSQVQSHGFGFSTRSSAPVEGEQSVSGSSAAPSVGSGAVAPAAPSVGGSKFNLLSSGTTGRAKKENEKLSSIIAKGLGMG